MRETKARHLKEILKSVTPPVLWHFARETAHLFGGPREWEYVPKGWSYRTSAPAGWNHPSIVTAQEAKWEEFQRLVAGCGPLGVAHEARALSVDDLRAHNAVMTFGYVLALAARGKEQLSLLDWGGGLGHYHTLAQTLMPYVRVDYHCKDVPLLAQKGRERSTGAHFYDNDEEAFARRYDVVMASNSLQYSENWDVVLHRLAASAERYLYITDLPLVEHSRSFVVLQRPKRYGYHTEYLCWFLNRSEFLANADSSAVILAREFLTGTDVMVPGAPEQSSYRGFLFYPKTAGDSIS